MFCVKLLTNSAMASIYTEEHMSTVTVFRMGVGPLPQEFEELFRQHRAFVFRAAYSVTGNAQDAEDVLQAIFLRIFRREFPPALRNNPKSYLYRAAVNESLTTIRSVTVRVTASWWTSPRLNHNPMRAVVCSTLPEGTKWKFHIRYSSDGMRPDLMERYAKGVLGIRFANSRIPVM